MKIALVGNPNSGKTTLFNAVTGASQYVGNWPGVTVEKKSGKVKGHKDVEIVDLPGIYSLSPYTLEEVVSRNFLIDENPDVIINIIDSTNLERNLYLTTQVLEVGKPVVIALNMVDALRKKGDEIDKDKLGKLFGCKVVETSALKGEGCEELIKTAINAVNSDLYSFVSYSFTDNLELLISQIEEIISPIVSHDSIRWYAIKLFERDKKVIEKLKISNNMLKQIENLTEDYEKKANDDAESLITSERYSIIDKTIKGIIKRKNETKTTISDKIDKILTNRILALPIFALIMFIIYYVSVSTVGSYLTDWVNDTLFGEIIPPAVEGFLTSIGTADWLNSLILDGIIGGVGAVLGFLPQMLILFLFLAILENCGYMSRIAFIMDRIFRNFGLSGKSFIPMLIGTGCSVPGIMASRTIESESDRKITIITTSFMPCSAKVPIIGLIAGALFGGAPWVAPTAYFIGVASIIVSGIILKKSKGFVGDTTPFVMELPPYHVPGVKDVLKHTWDRGKSFVKKAGTVIFVACGLIWFLSSFDFSMHMVETKDSILASLGKVIAPIFTPLGFGNWQSSVATITGLVAKENIVGTFGVLFNYAEAATTDVAIYPVMSQMFTQLSAFSFLLFNLLCAPCFAAVGAIKREMGNAKWTLIAVGYQTIYAYSISFMVYQIGMVLSGNGFTILTFIAIAVFAFILYRLVKKPHNSNSIEGKRGEYMCQQ